LITEAWKTAFMTRLQTFATINFHPSYELDLLTGSLLMNGDNGEAPNHNNLPFLAREFDCLLVLIDISCCPFSVESFLRFKSC